MTTCKRAGAWAIAAALVLTACGGGSGGGSAEAEAPRPPLPTVTRDDNPTVARLDVGPEDFLPANGQARWSFDRLDSAGVRLGSADLESSGTGNFVTVWESIDGVSVRSMRFDIGSAGWTLPSLEVSSLQNNISFYVGPILKFPRPFHGIGSTRVLYRSGNYGADLDGDGSNESFEFEFRQTMVGYETVQGPRGPLEALRIREELRLTLVPSRRTGSSRMIGSVTESWYARGLGLVREETAPIGAGDVQVPAPYALRLSTHTLDGIDPLADDTIRDALTLDIAHLDLVFDAERGRYYASVSGSVAGQGNRLAVIDAASGAVEYSRVVGSQPGVLAIAADGASLYVAVDGSNELLRLALPGLAELGRTRIGADVSGPFRVEAVAASPTDPDVVALSLARGSGSSRHLGVQLLRNMQVQPTRTSSSTSSNRIVFGADGRWLFGLNIETSELGLRRIEVLPDGLEERSRIMQAVPVFNVHGLERTARGLVAGSRLYAEDTLAPQGLISGGQECRALAAGTRLVCTVALFASNIELIVADVETTTIQTTLRMYAGSSTRRLLVPGPSGQLAVRDGVDNSTQFGASRILLLRHPALP